MRGRPKKYRIVRHDPKIVQFSPRGRPGRPDEAELGRDAYEAMRLVDHMGLSQKEAARSMNISQQTLSRILKRAHKVVADSLIRGNIIKIQGGSYVFSHQDLETNPRQISEKNK